MWNKIWRKTFFEYIKYQSDKNHKLLLVGRYCDGGDDDDDVYNFIWLLNFANIELLILMDRET